MFRALADEGRVLNDRRGRQKHTAADVIKAMGFLFYFISSILVKHTSSSANRKR